MLLLHTASFKEFESLVWLWHNVKLRKTQLEAIIVLIGFSSIQPASVSASPSVYNRRPHRHHGTSLSLRTSPSFREKNKKFAEQGSALTCCVCLGIDGLPATIGSAPVMSGGQPAADSGHSAVSDPPAAGSGQSAPGSGQRAADSGQSAAAAAGASTGDGETHRDRGDVSGAAESGASGAEPDTEGGGAAVSSVDSAAAVEAECQPKTNGVSSVICPVVGGNWKRRESGCFIGLFCWWGWGDKASVAVLFVFCWIVLSVLFCRLCHERVTPLFWRCSWNLVELPLVLEIFLKNW